MKILTKVIIAIVCVVLIFAFFIKRSEVVMKEMKYQEAQEKFNNYSEMMTKEYRKKLDTLSALENRYDSLSIVLNSLARSPR